MNDNSPVSDGALIEIKGLKKAFAGCFVLQGVDLEVEQGRLTVLIGPSGCGKSTLLRCLSGLEAFDDGSLTIGGVTLAKNASARRDGRTGVRRRLPEGFVGMVFQSFNLFPHMTVLDNVSRAPVIVKGLPKRQARSEALQLLDKVGLRGKADLVPHQLSGGEQQRAAIARALAMKPGIMLYDEPTSALDPTLVDEVLEVMKELDSEGITQLVVTHEMRFARNAADKVVFMCDGVVVEEGPAEEMFSRPADTRTRQFLRRYL